MTVLLGSDILNTYSAKENARFFGRTLENGQEVYFDWSGSGFEFCFEGTAAYAEFSVGGQTPDPGDRAYLGVYVDDMPYLSARFPLTGNGKYALAENLPYGEHKIKVIKDTEMWYGRAAVSKIMTDGKVLPLPDKKKLNIEFIGDSITCGYGDICSNASPDFITREESFAETYAAKTAIMLDADISVVAASGNGFYHDYGCSTNNLIPELYLYQDKLLSLSLGLELKPRDFSEDKCDLVVIKLGQNDGQYCMGADTPPDLFTKEEEASRKAAFKDRAAEFFKTVLKLRKGVPVILIYESDMFLKNEVVCAAKETGGKINLLEITPKRDYEGVGANGHFSTYTHTRLANLLIKRIKEIC